jgi:hypothetical protein
VRKEIANGALVEWLSKTPQDSDVIVRTSPHLAETQPHNDQKLQDWDTPNQEQINKLKAESQKTKPKLANHDHQVLIQTEPDDNVKDSRYAQSHLSLEVFLIAILRVHRLLFLYAR